LRKDKIMSNENRQTPSVRIMDFLGDLVSMSQNLVVDVARKLEPLCLPEQPKPGKIEDPKIEFPPLFLAMYEQLCVIRDSLKTINNIVGRCDI